MMARAVDMDIQVDRAQLAEVERLLASVPGGVDRVMVTSVNSTATTGRKRIVQELGKKLALTQTRIRKDTTLRKAVRGHVAAVITIRGKRIMLIEFQARDTGRRGVTYRIERGGKRARVAEGFIARSPRGTELVWRRMGKPRLPIVPLRGPSIPAAFERAEAMQREVLEETAVLLERRIWQKVNWLLEKRAGAVA